MKNKLSTLSLALLAIFAFLAAALTAAIGAHQENLRAVNGFGSSEQETWGFFACIALGLIFTIWVIMRMAFAPKRTKSSKTKHHK